VIGVMPEGFQYRETVFCSARSGHGSHLRATGTSGAQCGRTLPRWKSPIDAQKEGRSDQCANPARLSGKRGAGGVRVNRCARNSARDLRPALLVLLGAVGFVLLSFATTSRVDARARDRPRAGDGHPQRLAWNWQRLVRQLLNRERTAGRRRRTGGIGLAFWATRSIGLLTRDPRLLDVRIDSGGAGFAGAVDGGDYDSVWNRPSDRATRVDASELSKADRALGPLRSARLVSECWWWLRWHCAWCCSLSRSSAEEFFAAWSSHPGLRTIAWSRCGSNLPLNTTRRR